VLTTTTQGYNYEKGTHRSTCFNMGLKSAVFTISILSKWISWWDTLRNEMVESIKCSTYIQLWIVGHNINIFVSRQLVNSLLVQDLEQYSPLSSSKKCIVYNICDCLSENVPSSHDYKYLEIPIWNIQLNISQECKEVLTRISSLIFSYTISFSWQTLQRTASWIAHHFR